MPPIQDEILLGKLALSHGLVTREQLDVCVREQETTARPLGEILVRRGIISQVDLATLLAEQERNLQKAHDTTLRRKQDSLFGRVAVALKMVTQADANTCVREQAKIEETGKRMRLGKLMVQRGLLTIEQVVQVLEFQKKQVLYCEACDAMFNAPRLEHGKTFQCRHCRASLVAPQRVTHCEVEELFQQTDETQIAPGVNPAAGQPSTRPDETTDVSKAGSTKSTIPPLPDGSGGVVEHDDWFIAREGKPAGPFEYRVLRQMVEAGTFEPGTFVWRPEMDAWRVAGDVPEVAALFTSPASETAIVAPPTAPLPPGVDPPKLEGFHVSGYLGKGGLGHVFRARQLAMDRDVAIKELLPALAADPVFVERLVRDSRASARVGHPGIVQWIDMREVGGRRYFISEFVEGPRVSDLVAGGGAMSEIRALEVARDVALALDAAHRGGVLHRDVRPANIKLTADGNAKLTDLGMTRRPEHPPDGAPGTLPYVAPEARATGRMDPRAEIYSLGATLYQMASGSPAHDSWPVPDVRMVNPALSDRTANLLRKMMAREPEARHASAGEVAREIDQILAKGFVQDAGHVSLAPSPAMFAPQPWVPPQPAAPPPVYPTAPPSAPGGPPKKPIGNLRKRYRRR